MTDITELSDIQSESGIIGTLIYHPEYILHTDFLEPGYFSGVENGCIYWAIQELYKDGIDNIDAYNISNKLQSHPGVAKTIDKYNLPSIQEFFELYKTTARHSLEEYKMLAKNVTELAFKRDLVKTTHVIENACFNKNKTLEELSNQVYSDLDRLTRKYVSSTDVRPLGDSIDEYWQEIVNRRSADGLYGLPSKYPVLNQYFTYQTGELVVLQAKYKKGKSIFLMNEAIHKLRNGVPTLVVDTEMATRTYVERLIAHMSGVDIKRVQNGKYTKEEEEKILSCLAWFRDQPFVHIYDPQMTNEKLYSICNMLKYKMNLQFVVFDYMKSNETSTGDNYNILGAQCDFLHNRIAGELDLAVLSACQLNREGKVADSDKINRYLSVAIKWGFKTMEMVAKDGTDCGNAFAQVYVNRLGEHMPEDDENAYADFDFAGSTMTISEATQHDYENPF